MALWHVFWRKLVSLFFGPILQGIVFMFGMDMIRKVIDWSGPAIYIAMFALCVYMIDAAGWDNISFNLSSKNLDGWDEAVKQLKPSSRKNK